MKNLFVFLVLLITVIACSKEVDQLIDQPAAEPVAVEGEDKFSIDNFPNFERGGEQLLLGGVEVTCGSNECSSGAGNCSVEGEAGSDIWSCSCTGCKMTITPTLEGLQVKDSEGYKKAVLKQMAKEKLHLESLAKYTKIKHGQAITAFTKVVFDFQPKGTSILYHYELEDGSPKTVMYVNKFSAARNGGSSVEIDCSGECECVEQYNWRTDVSNCSCNPCKMTITVPSIDGPE